MRTTDTHVYFYGTQDIYSNFHSAKFSAPLFHDSFELGTETHSFNCSEQMFMAFKALHFDDLETFRKIMEATYPSTQKYLGREVKGFKEDEWKEVRLDYMKLTVLWKFGQIERLKNQIVNTYPRKIVEASINDRIWGVGLNEWDNKILDESNWLGENLLGESLMHARTVIMNEDSLLKVVQKFGN